MSPYTHEMTDYEFELQMENYQMRLLLPTIDKRSKIQTKFRRVTRGASGEVSSALFQKLEKSALIWRKNALIVVIYR